VLVLAAVHAGRAGAIRAAQLDDVDLGNRRLTIAGRVRPVDEFTHQVLPGWLDYRRTRWPDTANPHLLNGQQSAMGTGPVSTIYFAKTRLRGQAATLERLRAGRQPGEALAHGPDPLHLAAVFGLDPKTAIRYAENARFAPHHQDRGARSRQFPRTQGPERPIEHEEPLVHREDPSVRLNSGLSRPSTNNGTASHGKRLS
jgi:hypothetical protein